MAISISDFQSVPSSGIIPEKLLPASAFAFKFSFSYTGTASSNPFFTGEIVIDVLDATDQVKYRITIEEKYNFFVFPLGPGLVLYSWNWVGSYEKIGGVIGIDGAPMKTLGEGTFGVDPAEDSDTSDREVTVDSSFTSKIFTEPLEVGDRLKVKKHTLSSGFSPALTSLQIATARSGALPALYDPRCGQQFRIASSDGSTYLVRSRKRESGLTPEKAERRLVTDKKFSPLSLEQAPGDVLYLLGRSAGEVQLLRTLDEGKNWEEVLSVPSKITALATRLSRDKSTFYIYGLDADKKPAYEILKNSSGGWKSQTGGCEGKDLPTSKVVSLELSNGDELRLLATGKNGELLVFSSPNGKTYAQQGGADLDGI